jgi:hypothetical protein
MRNRSMNSLKILAFTLGVNFIVIGFATSLITAQAFAEDNATIVSIPASPLSRTSYDSNNETISLWFGEVQASFVVDSKLPEVQYFKLQEPKGSPQKKIVIRYISPLFYQKYGQDNGGVFVMSRGLDPNNISSDPRNLFAKEFEVAQTLSSADLSFLTAYSFLIDYNKIGVDRPLCTDSLVSDLLPAIRSGDCYVACSGNALVASQLAPGDSRVVLLYGRSDKLDGDHMFLWSEWHTTMELKDGERWYVADPTYGFAYVRDKTMQRLSTEELITALVDDPEGLVFGVIDDDYIREVPGLEMIASEPTLAGLYYTTDKKPTYQDRRR